MTSELLFNPSDVRFIAAIRHYIQTQCVDVLREPAGILKHPFIVPGSIYHNQLWDWDSWFTTVALHQIYRENANLNEESLIPYERGCALNFLDAMDDKGWVPIAIDCENGCDSFFGDAIRDTTVHNMHKPILAQRIDFCVRASKGETEWIAERLPALERFLGRYETDYHHETGLFRWADDYAIGADNDPCIFARPAGSSASIYLNCMLYREYLAMGDLTERIQGYSSSLRWRRKAESLRRAMQCEMWDERDGCYFSLDLNIKLNRTATGLNEGNPKEWNNQFMRVDTWSNLMPLWAGIATMEQAVSMVERHCMNTSTLNAAYGIRTLSRLEKMYDLSSSNNPSNWLGPVWGISNYIVFAGLVRYGFYEQAKDLALKTIRLFGQDIEQTGVMHEYYDPDTGHPIVNSGFQNWNLLVYNMIDWLENKWVLWE